MFNRIMSALLLCLFMASTTFSQAPTKDVGKFVEKNEGFWGEIKKKNAEFKKGNPKKFVMDFEGKDLPTNKDDYKTYWHNDPISQGNSGMCWCFSTTSFYESEIYRVTGKKVKISELYTVYWEYVEKAREYVRTFGHSAFAQGSEANHVPIIWKQYGCVPAEVYTGLKKDQPFHDHSDLFNEMDSYLKKVKEEKLWDKEQILTNIKNMLNHYIGKPPETFEVNGKEMTPFQYFKSLKFNLDDYADILSIKEKPYNEYVEYTVPDNWWHSDTYYNVDLDTFMKILKKAIRDEQTIVIGGDVSEAGYYSWAEVAMVPTFDIPSEYIDENARQFRFGNKTTTDDHGIHIVGYQEVDGTDWYLIKDSGSGSRNGENKGYYFYHEDYIKLKIMDFMVHKDVLKGIIDLPEYE